MTFEALGVGAVGVGPYSSETETVRPESDSEVRATNPACAKAGKRDAVAVSELVEIPKKVMVASGSRAAATSVMSFPTSTVE